MMSLPVSGLLDTNQNQATPHQLFYGSKPCSAHFHIFGCPTAVKKWTAMIEGCRITNQTQHGIRGIFIEFLPRQNSYLIYMPTTCTIVVCDDVSFVNPSFLQLLQPCGNLMTVLLFVHIQATHIFRTQILPLNKWVWFHVSGPWGGERLRCHFLYKLQ